MAKDTGVRAMAVVAADVKFWNEDYPPGAPVWHDGQITRSVSAAWIHEGTALITLEGMDRPVLLREVRAWVR